MYKLQAIYHKSFEINEQLHRTIEHFNEQTREAEDYFNYIMHSRKAGNLFGDLGKMFLSNRRIDDPNTDLYVYPDDRLDLETPTVDKLVFPGENYDLYPRFEESNWFSL